MGQSWGEMPVQGLALKDQADQATEELRAFADFAFPRKFGFRGET